MKKIISLLFVLLAFMSCSEDKVEDVEKPVVESEDKPTDDSDNNSENTEKVDPNFQIYICFGQSNMEGNATPEDVDKENVSERFKVMCATSDDEAHNNRKQGEWYTAVPPLCRWNTGLTPADYFGRKLIANQSSDVKIGVIMVAMGGSGIDAFDKVNYKEYYDSSVDWFKGYMDAYGGNPYQRIVSLAKKAQKQGVIKGILVHQGETNNMQTDWPDKLNKIYNDFMEDLSLNSDTVPLLVGEMLDKEHGGACYGMNDIIATLPSRIKNCHVISSEGCPGRDDNLHFTAEGYRIIGKKYADKMLELMNLRDAVLLNELTVSGHFLKDTSGKVVNLHGFAQTYSPWFNEECRKWNNYDVDACLRYNKNLIDRILEAGWKMDFVRLHMDPYWSNQPGAQVTGENDISAFSMDRFKKYLDEVFIPMARYINSKGLYVVMRPPGVCPEKISIGDSYQNYLINVWSVVADNGKLKNNPGIMFELANEPVTIKGTDGNYAGGGDGQFKNLSSYFQKIVDAIRSKGADNILWIPGLGWQSQYSGFAKYPIKGDNIGYAVHVYPGWFNSGSGYEAFQRGWNEQVQPAADIAPIMVTEMDWAPEKYNASWGKAETGVSGGDGFGANFKKIVDAAGNVSWLLFTWPHLLANFTDVSGTPGSYTFLNDPQACPWPVYHWYKEYADNKDKE